MKTEKVMKSKTSFKKVEISLRRKSYEQRKKLNIKKVLKSKKIEENFFEEENEIQEERKNQSERKSSDSSEGSKMLLLPTIVIFLHTAVQGFRMTQQVSLIRVGLCQEQVNTFPSP